MRQSINTHLGTLKLSPEWEVTIDSGGVVKVERSDQHLDLILIGRTATGYRTLHRGPDGPFALESKREELFPDTWGAVQDVVSDVTRTGRFLDYAQD